LGSQKPVLNTHMRAWQADKELFESQIFHIKVSFSQISGMPTMLKYLNKFQ